MKICCVSVDVDGIDHYYGIHGLLPAGATESGLCHGLAIDRLLEWASTEDIPLTWFVIGRDTNRPEFVQLLRGAIDRGHEIANHSHDHRYDLVRLAPEAQQVQVFSAGVHLERAFGVRPLGFRAPGYTVSDTLLDIVERQGYVYDSSVFPCLPYYAAKAAILLTQRIVGRTSRSILDSPRVLGAPTNPYRIGRPYSRRGHGLLEIPVQVTPWGRLPFIGTALATMGPRWAKFLTGALTSLPFVNLELHAIDMLCNDDGLNGLSKYQHDLRLPLTRKSNAFSAAVTALKKAGYTFVTMLEAARQLDSEPIIRCQQAK
jgi:peptidoglycan-N-acetylglucosamine deacetylase